MPTCLFTTCASLLLLFRWICLYNFSRFHILLLLFFSHPVMADFLQPHGLQHTRPSCPSSSPRVCPSFCLLHWWCHPAISSLDALFSFCPWSFPASGTFPQSQLFTSDDQNTGVSASASVLPINIQLISLKTDWFDLLAVQGTFKSLFQHYTLKASIVWCSAFFTVQLSQPYVTTEKTIVLTIWTFVSRVMSLLFNTLSRFVIAFLPRSNRLLISWLQSPSTVIFGAQEEETCHSFHFPLLFAMQ